MDLARLLCILADALSMICVFRRSKEVDGKLYIGIVQDDDLAGHNFLRVIFQSLPRIDSIEVL